MDTFEFYIFFNSALILILQVGYYYLLSGVSKIYRKGTAPLLSIGLRRVDAFLLPLAITTFAMLFVAIDYVEDNMYLTTPITLALFIAFNYASRKERVTIDFYDTFLRIVYPVIGTDSIHVDLPVESIQSVVFESGSRATNLYINFSAEGQEKSVRLYQWGKRNQVKEYFDNRNIEVYKKQSGERVIYPDDE